MRKGGAAVLIYIFTFQTPKEQEKFEAIFHRYQKLLLYKAYDVLKDYVLAEDAVSEAFLRVYKNLHKIEDVDSPATASFLVTIVRNAALTIRQKEKRNVTELYDDDFAEQYEDDYNLEEEILADISSAHILSLLDSLEEQQRAVFVLKFAHGYSHKEIGTLLNLSENNVTVKLFRAKKRLAGILMKEGYGHESS